MWLILHTGCFLFALLFLFYHYVKDRFPIRRSSPNKKCGEYRIRTDDPLLAKQVL
ncbi:hypothetical protein PORCAN_2112 [Porphyromonas crevioricanis JCM 13913]|nr:hypothetical protein PORCAN_2112 [Porphyromonas crevioricanis JCM 13913]